MAMNEGAATLEERQEEAAEVLAIFSDVQKELEVEQELREVGVVSLIMHSRD